MIPPGSGAIGFAGSASDEILLIFTYAVVSLIVELGFGGDELAQSSPLPNANGITRLL